MKYGKRAPWKKYLYSPVSIVVIAVILFFLIRAAWNFHDKAVLSDKKLALVQQELASLKQQKANLANSIEYLSTPEGIEATLRDKYHAVKEGESVVVIVDPQQNKEASTSKQPKQQNYSWWQKILHFIGL